MNQENVSAGVAGKRRKNWKNPGLSGLGLFALLVATGCTALLESGSGDGDGAGDGSGAGAGAGEGDGDGTAVTDTSDGVPGINAPPGAKEGAGLNPLRRLTRQEYGYTIQSLLGEGATVAVELPDDTLGGSTYATPTIVGNVELDGFERAANELAQTQSARIAELATCDAGGTEEACAQGFISTFGARVFRRPLTVDESAALLGLYQTMRAAPISSAHSEAVSTVFAAMLQSPAFLYHWELGSDAPVIEGDLIRLNGYEIASRLSYFLWSTMPDEALFAAAASGALDTEEGVRAEATRMLSAPHAGRVATGMLGQWIHIGKLPALTKDPSVGDVTPELRASMQKEFDLFVVDKFLTQSSYAETLTSSNHFVDSQLAALYGLGGSYGAEFSPVVMSERKGLFGLSSFLAIEALPQESSPVRRGKTMTTRLLCRDIKPPPKGVVIEIPTVPDGSTTREAYQIHQTDPVCAGCHQYMDPLGFAFENFDAMGRYRATENGKPIDSTGALVALDGGADVPFVNAEEMMAAVLGSEEGKTCLVEQLTRYGLSRDLGTFDDPTLGSVVEELGDDVLNVKALLPVLASSKSFRYRVGAEGEITQ